MSVSLQRGYTEANLLIIITSAFAKDSCSLFYFLSEGFILLPESNKTCQSKEGGVK